MDKHIITENYNKTICIGDIHGDYSVIIDILQKYYNITIDLKYSKYNLIVDTLNHKFINTYVIEKINIEDLQILSILYSLKLFFKKYKTLFITDKTKYFKLTHKYFNYYNINNTNNTNIKDYNECIILITYNIVIYLCKIFNITIKINKILDIKDIIENYILQLNLNTIDLNITENLNDLLIFILGDVYDPYNTNTMVPCNNNNSCILKNNNKIIFNNGNEILYKSMLLTHIVLNILEYNDCNIKYILGNHEINILYYYPLEIRQKIIDEFKIFYLYKDLFVCHFCNIIYTQTTTDKKDINNELNNLYKFMIHKNNIINENNKNIKLFHGKKYDYLKYFISFSFKENDEDFIHKIIYHYNNKIKKICCGHITHDDEFIFKLYNCGKNILIYYIDFDLSIFQNDYNTNIYRGYYDYNNDKIILDNIKIKYLKEYDYCVKLKKNNNYTYEYQDPPIGLKLVNYNNKYKEIITKHDIYKYIEELNKYIKDINNKYYNKIFNKDDLLNIYIYCRKYVYSLLNNINDKQILINIFNNDDLKVFIVFILNEEQINNLIDKLI